MSDGGARHHQAAQRTAPKGLRIRDRIARRMLLDGNLDKPARLQKLEEFAGVGETVHIVALWHVGRYQCADLGDGLAEDALNALPSRTVPPGKRNASARPQRTRALG